MYPLAPKRLPEAERRLLALFSGLDTQDRDSLLAFAEFLAGRARSAAPAPEPPSDPVAIARPERESVVAAIKRLSQTYPMLERSALLNETSSLMVAHVMHGRAAASVIDDLEILFADHFARYRAQRNPDQQP